MRTGGHLAIRGTERRQSKTTQHSYKLTEGTRKISTKMMVQEPGTLTAETENCTIMEGVEIVIEG